MLLAQLLRKTLHQILSEADERVPEHQNGSSPRYMLQVDPEQVEIFQHLTNEGAITLHGVSYPDAKIYSADDPPPDDERPIVTYELNSADGETISVRQRLEQLSSWFHENDPLLGDVSDGRTILRSTAFGFTTLEGGLILYRGNFQHFSPQDGQLMKLLILNYDQNASLGNHEIRENTTTRGGDLDDRRITQYMHRLNRKLASIGTNVRAKTHNQGWRLEDRE